MQYATKCRVDCFDVDVFICKLPVAWGRVSLRQLDFYLPLYVSKVSEFFTGLITFVRVCIAMWPTISCELNGLG